MTGASAIYVQGCARSGNTLMRELCGACFHKAQLIPLDHGATECGLNRVITQTAVESSTHVWVASRDRATSLHMEPSVLRDHPKIGVIWMIRHPFDVLTSRHALDYGRFYVTPERLLQSVQLYEAFCDEPQVAVVPYEELVSYPEKIQELVAARFDLSVRRPFGMGYRAFRARSETVKAMHGIRPLDSESVGRWHRAPACRIHITSLLDSHPELIECVRRIGYDPAP